MRSRLDMERRMPQEDNEYFEKRAAQERALAAVSDKPEVARVHLEMAANYQAMANRVKGNSPFSPPAIGSVGLDR